MKIAKISRLLARKRVTVPSVVAFLLYLAGFFYPQIQEVGSQLGDMLSSSEDSVSSMLEQQL